MGQAIKPQYHTHNHSNSLYRSLRLRSRAWLEAFGSYLNSIAIRDPYSECSLRVADAKQRPDPASSIADGPANHTPRIQIKNDSKVKPPFVRPNIGYIARPFLVGAIPCQSQSKKGPDRGIIRQRNSTGQTSFKAWMKANLTHCPAVYVYTNKRGRGPQRNLSGHSS